MREETELSERFWSHVDRTEGCWIWTGYRDDTNYGRFNIKGYPLMVHRLTYVNAYGPFDPSLQLDHLCHTRDLSCKGGVTCPHRPCVNPAHLEPVTADENYRRGRAVGRTHCKHGHPFVEGNVRIATDSLGRKSRRCLTCHRNYQARMRIDDGDKTLVFARSEKEARAAALEAGLLWNRLLYIGRPKTLRGLATKGRKRRYFPGFEEHYMASLIRDALAMSDLFEAS